MGTKGEEERGHKARQPPEDTRQQEQASEDKRREGRREGHGRNKPRGRGDTDDSSREQREQKKEYVIFKGEKRGKTPLRLAKACKCVYIHCT